MLFRSVVAAVADADYGYSIGRAIAVAALPVALAVPGTAVAIGFLGERFPATVAAEPLR